MNEQYSSDFYKVPDIIFDIKKLAKLKKLFCAKVWEQ